jgi:AraC family transcriptional regulator
MLKSEFTLKGPIELAQDVLVKPSASSDQLGWEGLHAFRFDDLSGREVYRAAQPLHSLVLVTRSPEKLSLRFGGVKREKPAPVGSISVVPARESATWWWEGNKTSLHIFLEPSIISRVAVESFELDPARIEIPPLDGLNLPSLRAAMLAVDAELRMNGPGGPLMVESLANMLAVYLIRHISGTGQMGPRGDSVLPKRKLQTVVEYIWENLESGLTLEQMAAVTYLSPYHFARQFKMATGMPPHHYVIARRVERAQEILHRDDEIGLSEVALQVGFCDQSHLTSHFKRIMGVTPGQYRLSAGIS